MCELQPKKKDKNLSVLLDCELFSSTRTLPTAFWFCRAALSGPNLSTVSPCFYKDSHYEISLTRTFFQNLALIYPSNDVSTYANFCPSSQLAQPPCSFCWWPQKFKRTKMLSVTVSHTYWISLKTGRSDIRKWIRQQQLKKNHGLRVTPALAVSKDGNILSSLAFPSKNTAIKIHKTTANFTSCFTGVKPAFAL
jgi:hypothetical protein